MNNALVCGLSSRRPIGTDYQSMNNASRFSGFSSLVLSAAMALTTLPGSAHAQACDMGTTTLVPLSLVGSHQYPALPVTIDGQNANMLLETESRVTLLHRAPLEKLGVKVRRSETTYAGVDIMVALLSQLNAAGIDAKGHFSVVDSDDDAAGSLGMSHFLRKDLDLWLANKEMRVSRPSGCRKAFLASWDPQAHTVDFKLDPSLKDLRPWFKVRINGTDVSATIATGSPYSYLDLHTAARLGIRTDAPDVAPSGEIISWRDTRMKVWRAPVSDLSIGNYKVPQASLRVFDMSLSGEMMVLGLDFLRNHRVLISMSQRRIYISHLGGPTFSEPAVQE